MRHEVANPHPDPGVQIKIESLLYESNQSFGRQEGAKAVQRLEQTIKAARETNASHKLSSVQNIRNKLAHRLKETRAEKGPTTVHPAKYGHEKDLLDETINVLGGLHFSINGVDWDWENSRRISRENALALWKHCSFDIRH